MQCNTTQRWKLNETLSKKEGVRRSIYEINRKPSSSDNKKVESEWEIGKTYTGEWSNDMRDGYGVQIWSNQQKYEGEWKRDERNGFGVHWIPLPSSLPTSSSAKRKDDVTWIYGKNGQQLASHTSDNVSALLRIRNDLCKTKSKSAKTKSKSTKTRLHKQYEGEWRDDVKHGKGSLYYENGDKFEGQFARGQRSGYGVMEYANGDKYEGDWKLNRRNGFGIYLSAPGKEQSLYTGYWMNGEKEGPGHFEKDGTLYVAEWVHGTPRSGYFVDEANHKATKAALKLKLLRPDSVLSTEVKKIRNARKLIRSLSIIDDIDDLFDGQRAVKLKVLDIYAQISFGENCVAREDLMQSVLDFELNAAFDCCATSTTAEMDIEHETLTNGRHEQIKMCVAQHCDDLGVRKSSASERANVVFVVTQLEYAKIIYLLLN